MGNCGTVEAETADGDSKPAARGIEAPPPSKWVVPDGPTQTVELYEELVVSKEAGGMLGLTFWSSTAKVSGVREGTAMAQSRCAPGFIGRTVTHVNGTKVGSAMEILNLALPAATVRLTFAPFREAAPQLKVAKGLSEDEVLAQLGKALDGTFDCEAAPGGARGDRAKQAVRLQVRARPAPVPRVDSKAPPADADAPASAAAPAPPEHTGVDPSELDALEQRWLAFHAEKQ